MATVDCEREMADLHPGDHLLFLHESEREQRDWITPFLCEGLERGEQVKYALDVTRPETVVCHLQAAGIDAEACLHSGQLELPSVREVYFPGGRFDPEAMLRAWDSLIEQAEIMLDRWEDYNEFYPAPPRVEERQDTGFYDRRPGPEA